MNAKDLIAALEKLNPDEEVKIVEDESRTDRYGEAYGLKVGVRFWRSSISVTNARRGERPRRET